MIASAPMARQMSAFCSLLTTQMGLRRRRARTACVRAESTRGAPDQDVVALLHPGALRDTNCRYAWSSRGGCGGLLPAEVVRLGISWLDFNERDLGEAAEVGLEPQMRCSGRASCRVTVARLQLDGEAVRDDLVPGRFQALTPDRCGSTTPEVGADDVVRQVVTALSAHSACRSAPGIRRSPSLEDRGPDRVVVDRGAITATSASPGPSSGTGTSSRWTTCAVLLTGLEPATSPSRLVHGDRAVRVGQRQGAKSADVAVCD